MNVTQTSVDNLFTGNGIADETAKPITALTRKAFKGTTLRCNAGTVYIGKQNVTTETGFVLAAGDNDLLVPIEDPSKIYVVGSGTFSWLSV